jgi:hypothetical protein
MLERSPIMENKQIQLIARPPQMVKGKGSMDMYFVELL